MRVEGLEEYIVCVSGRLEFIGVGDGMSLNHSVFSSRPCRIAGAFLFIGVYRYLVFEFIRNQHIQTQSLIQQ